MPTLNHSVKLSLAEWNEIVSLLQSLIRAHPIYASKGLSKAQNTLLEYLVKKGWKNIYEDIFYASDIENLPEYVKVEKFGKLYENYKEIPKKNLIGVIEGSNPGPTIIFNGHIDVDIVADKNWRFENGWKGGKIHKGKVYGRGATDMLSGLVGLVAVGSLLLKNRDLWKGRIILTAVTDEEIGGNGTLRSLHWLKTKGLLSENTEAIIAEPSDQSYALSSLGFLHFSAEVYQKACHMGAFHKNKHTLGTAAKFYEKIDTLLLKAGRELDPKVDENSLVSNIGRINGGEDPTIPIVKLQWEGTIFHPSSIKSHELKTTLQNLIEKNFPEIKFKWNAFNFEGATFEYGNLCHALELSRNMSFPCKLFKSPCDARLFKKFKIPTLIYGPGHLLQAHSTDEFIQLEDLRNYIEHLTDAMLLL